MVKPDIWRDVYVTHNARRYRVRFDRDTGEALRVAVLVVNHTRAQHEHYRHTWRDGDRRIGATARDVIALAKAEPALTPD